MPSLTCTRPDLHVGPNGWPDAFPVLADGSVREGLVVRSISGAVEGRTTGARLRCYSTGCPRWFIGVSWETGQRMRPCSEGWHFHPETSVVSICGGGEISARFVSPKPLGTPPHPKPWPPRTSLARGKGWRLTP